MNSPVVVGWFVLAVGLCLIGSVLVAEVCAARTAERLAPVVDEQWAEDDPLFDQDDPCLNPNLHASQGCQVCIRTLQAIRDRIICQEILWLGTKEPQRGNR